MNAIIVTGGTRGIGRAIVDALADRLLAKEPDLGGARLVVTYRSEKAHAEALAAALRSKGVVADVLAMDLASGESIDAFVGQMRENYGAVRALINNAGATYDGSFLSMSDEGMGKLIESNLSGTIRLTEGLLPLLRAANPAAVVFIASAAGVYGKAGQVPYATTKGGLIGYTQLLARRCVRQNIFVNAVAPASSRLTWSPSSIRSCTNRSCTTPRCKKWGRRKMSRMSSMACSSRDTCRRRPSRSMAAISVE